MLSCIIPDNAATNVRLRFARAGTICDFLDSIPNMQRAVAANGMQALLEKPGPQASRN